VELHEHVAGDEEPESSAAGMVGVTMVGTIGQIILLDAVFSLDSIITAVGLTDDIPIMFAAVLIAVGAMMLAAGPLSRLMGDNPTVVTLALGFLLMIGTTLLANGMGVHIPKGYIYAAMAFAALIEGLNMIARRRRDRHGRSRPRVRVRGRRRRR
jgi:predicted tellurium resistance membrane protein TerC